MNGVDKEKPAPASTATPAAKTEEKPAAEPTAEKDAEGGPCGLPKKCVIL